MPPKDNIQDYVGKTINGLTILREDGYNQNQKRMVWCKCNYCNEEKSIIFSRVKTGKTKSCGCLITKSLIERSTKHGLCWHPLYGVWENIKTRCYNPNAKRYDCYGGRGIILCDKWRNSFEEFFFDCIELGWEDGLQIDRINNDGNYDPRNVRFVTNQENSLNKRLLFSNNTSGYPGVIFHKAANSWYVQIRYDGNFLVRKSGFNTAEDAARFRDQYIIDNELPLQLCILNLIDEERLNAVKNCKPRWE